MGKFFKWVWSMFGGPSAATPEFVIKVQGETVKLCGFLPMASSVAAVIGAMTGQTAAAATAVGVAGSICRAVSSMPRTLIASDVKPVVEIDGVAIEIEGEFVGKPQ